MGYVDYEYYKDEFKGSLEQEVADKRTLDYLNQTGLTSRRL